MQTGWLLRDGEVLAAADLAETFWDRNRGLVGRSTYDGAMILSHTRAVHSFAMRFPLDVAFVDRDHPGTAASLKPFQAAARKGLSVLIAPEGARFDTKSVGPFKKRAFLIAMATRLPIVPVVIRNSESVAGRNAATLNPGTVDIAVLPPVSVENWSLRDLGERIEQVRAAYLATLAAWPAETPRARATVPDDA